MSFSSFVVVLCGLSGTMQHTSRSVSDDELRKWVDVDLSSFPAAISTIRVVRQQNLVFDRPGFKAVTGIAGTIRSDSASVGNELELHGNREFPAELTVGVSVFDSRPVAKYVFWNKVGGSNARLGESRHRKTLWSGKKLGDASFSWPPDYRDSSLVSTTILKDNMIIRVQFKAASWIEGRGIKSERTGSQEWEMVEKLAVETYKKVTAKKS